jgi:3-hydroxyisobutyrate dehydrogenase
MDSNQTKVGWIGTGVMGNHMCQYLLKAKYDLYVYNRTEEKANNLIELGAKFEEPSEIAKRVDYLFLMLGYPKDVEDIVFNKGILDNLKPGSYLIDHTTSSPELAIRINKEAEKKNIYSYDAPVSGGEIGAKEGRLVVMIGGDKEKFNKIENIISKYSSKRNIMGEAGNGQHTKLANQIIIVEGLLYGYKANLDLNNMIALLSGGQHNHLV